DLPQPLSPTMPTTWPGKTSKLTPSTALTRPSSIANATRRSRTASSGAPGLDSARTAELGDDAPGGDDPDASPGGEQVLPEPVVVADDRHGVHVRPVRGGVPVFHHDHVEVPAGRRPHRRVDAEVRRAARHDQLLGLVLPEDRGQVRLVEGVTRALVDHDVAV